MRSYRYFRHGIYREFLFVWRFLILSIVNIIPSHPAYRPLQDFRNHILRLIGIKIGKESNISERFYVYDCGRLIIGNKVNIGAFAQIHNIAPVSMGDNLLISHNLTIVSGTHSTKDFSAIHGPVVIGTGVWIGANVTIIGPVVIGNNSIIGACSLIMKDVPDNAIVAGIPARIIRYRIFS
jgi:acetyltransferase-like isoleucine patch superfamily enzyme